MKQKIMRTLCILAAISQVSLILMVLCGYITIGVESLTEETVEEDSIKDKDTTEYVDKAVEVTDDKTESENSHHKTPGSKVSKESGENMKHKLFNNLVDSEKNKQEEKSPPSTARWCRDVWENFSPEVDVQPYSDISGSESSSYESSD